MINFNWYTFSELTAEQLYDILQLRSSIFVVEQRCNYLDADGKDQSALHLLGKEKDALVAYLRLFPPRESQSDIVFGRVLTALSARAKGYGKKLLEEMLRFCHNHFPDSSIKCSAQYYLKKFYEGFGFIAYGEIYEEANIPHIAMRKEVAHIKAIKIKV
jgi:ElaA protein